MSTLSAALALALKGFFIIPLGQDSKLPVLKGWPKLATRDSDKITAWWTDPVLEAEASFNIGISTSNYGEGEALLVVDVDTKNGMNGFDSIFNLEMEGYSFPKTYTQGTPSGGQHLVYRVPHPVKQGTSVLGPGLDVRSAGGQFAGAGSSINGKPYTVVADHPVAEAPEWMVAKCGAPKVKNSEPSRAPVAINEQTAIGRGKHYLEKECPTASSGNRNGEAFKAAAKLKDLGVGEVAALELMSDAWPCSPPLEHEELEHVVASAYRYGRSALGSSSPEADFAEEPEEIKTAEDTKKHPFDVLNERYAFVAGGTHHILWETTDVNGDFLVVHMNEQSFHKKFAAWRMVTDGRERAVTELWIRSPRRRSYDGICFAPGRTAPANWYNLWRGFTVEPLPKGEKPTPEMEEAVEMFLSHAKDNFAHGDEELFRWIIGYFAHLVQKPWEKPLVAIVFRGRKGVGKNALVERVGDLLGPSFMVVSDKRYLLGNFNAFLENKLLFVLDEAFWSGDKQAEGILKNLITGRTHVIERKGKEPYSVDNCTRVVIIGNEEWLVAASQDERRFAVFDVGESRMQDRAFFQRMRELMKNEGGSRYLLRYLLDFDLSQVDVNAAPTTEGLLEQKLISMGPLEQFWLECLENGRLTSGDFEEGWPTLVDKDVFRAGLKRYVKERNIGGRMQDARSIGKTLKRMAPSIPSNQKRRDGKNFINVYRLPTLEVARQEWEVFIGHKVNWE